MSMCPMCLAGLPSSCLTKSCESMVIEPTIQSIPQETLSLIVQETGTINDEGGLVQGEEAGRLHSEREGNDRLTGRRSSGRNKADSQSAGRKIAARRYPLEPEAPCEWQGKGDCGGGDFPILGCLEGKQQARHHGPEKNVSNNEYGNVHRICHYCHNRWHAANDPTYDWNAGVWPAHNPRPLTDEERKTVALDYMRYQTTGRNRKKIKETD